MEYILGGILAILAIAFFRMTLRTVPQAHVMIIERLGRYHRTLNSGLNIVLPIIDKPSPFLMRRSGQLALQSYVDLREMVLGLDSEQVITRDNVGMGVGSVIYYQVIDPVKAKEIRSLLELIGARDAIQDAASSATEQYRQKMLETSANNDRAQVLTNAYLAEFQKKFDADAVTNQLVGIYDKHFTEDEIKDLLEFYGSPLGQKVAAEVPKISREASSVSAE